MKTISVGEKGDPKNTDTTLTTSFHRAYNQAFQMRYILFDPLLLPSGMLLKLSQFNFSSFFALTYFRLLICWVKDPYIDP